MPAAGFGSSVCALKLKLSYLRNLYAMADSSKQNGPQAIPVTCKRCGDEFASKTKLLLHNKTCLAYRCEQCDVRYKKKKDLEKHVKDTHRKRFTCDLCPEAEPPFMSENALINHQQTQHDIAILCSLCGESFTDAYHRARHTREKHDEQGGVELICDCGDTFNRKDNFDRHQDTCMLSKRGATKAIKRRFEELSGQMDDRNAACTMSFAEVCEMAQKRLECVCASCTKHFKNDSSLKKHECRKQA